VIRLLEISACALGLLTLSLLAQSQDAHATSAGPAVTGGITEAAFPATVDPALPTEMSVRSAAEIPNIRLAEWHPHHGVIDTSIENARKNKLPCGRPDCNQLKPPHLVPKRPLLPVREIPPSPIKPPGAGPRH